MSDRLKSFGAGIIGMGLVLALWFGFGWAKQRYLEFQVMRVVTIAVVCKDYKEEAPKIGVTCPEPAPPVVPGDVSPPGPVTK